MEKYQRIKVKTWFLEYNSEHKIGAIREEINSHRWIPENVKSYLANYREIGNQYGWTGRLLMTDLELRELISSPSIFCFHLIYQNQIAGYFEIEVRENSAEIVYLGLKSNYIGKGLGKSLIQSSINESLKRADKVWLHTCEYDHPNALNSYKKCGFEVIKDTIDEAHYPTTFLETWKISNNRICFSTFVINHFSIGAFFSTYENDQIF